MHRDCSKQVPYKTLQSWRSMHIITEAHLAKTDHIRTQIFEDGNKTKCRRQSSSLHLYTSLSNYIDSLDVAASFSRLLYKGFRKGTPKTVFSDDEANAKSCKYVIPPNSTFAHSNTLWSLFLIEIDSSEGVNKYYHLIAELFPRFESFNPGFDRLIPAFDRLSRWQQI